MRSIANKEAANMKLAADYRALARDALRGRWKTAVLAGLLASALGANIVNATENITSNANRANQNSNITPGGSLELFSQANGGRLLAVLVVCIVVWTLFTLVVGGAVRLGYARFNLNLADGKAAAVPDTPGVFLRLVRDRFPLRCPGKLPLGRGTLFLRGV